MTSRSSVVSAPSGAPSVGVPLPLDLARPALACGGTTATWADVVRDGRRTGLWGDLEAQVAGRQAAVSARPPAPEEVSRAAVAERRARRLLSTDDLRAWCTAWSFEQSDWLAHIRRSLVEPLPPQVVADPLAVWTTAVCSGIAEAAAQRLAEGLAAALLLGLDSSDPDARDRARERVAAAAATADAVTSSITSRGIDGTRFRWSRAVLADGDAAREAVLCLREDGLTLDDLGVPSTPHQAALDEVAPRLRPALLGAGRDGVVHPVSDDEPGALLVVTERRPPDPEDPVLRVEASERLRARALDTLVADGVRWLGPLTAAGA